MAGYFSLKILKIWRVNIKEQMRSGSWRKEEVSREIGVLDCMRLYYPTTERRSCTEDQFVLLGT